MKCSECKVYHGCAVQLFDEEKVELKCNYFKRRVERKPGFKKKKMGLVKYDKNGKINKNWVKLLKKKSRMNLKDKCEKCPATKRLTIHHIKKITGGTGIVTDIESFEELKKLILSKKNCQTLCRKCHNKVHGIEPHKTEENKDEENNH